MKLGIDQSNYSKIERGVLLLTIEQCKEFALFFGMSTDYVLELTDVKEPYPRRSGKKLTGV